MTRGRVGSEMLWTTWAVRVNNVECGYSEAARRVNASTFLSCNQLHRQQTALNILGCIRPPGYLLLSSILKKCVSSDENPFNIIRLPPIRLRRTQLLYRLPSNAEHHLSCIRLKTGIEPQDNAVFAPVYVEGEGAGRARAPFRQATWASGVRLKKGGYAWRVYCCAATSRIDRGQWRVGNYLQPALIEGYGGCLSLTIDLCNRRTCTK
ncbi:hypothetical protein Moror_4104 [Moniliophthora roreri MCA 2997]|uniref:Uncharacterized protein n=1 Tax=Moniliophthora roreri (strain MCA 2997) TaxID=1381753 RepID=V2XD47_MONRO|nr:hypothetical protein Moror_4104 [Moniliophthora roreri MCA 2997]